MTSSHDKLNDIRQELSLHHEPYITRIDLKRIIMKAIDIHEPHTVNAWIDKLVAYEVVEEHRGYLNGRKVGMAFKVNNHA